MKKEILLMSLIVLGSALGHTQNPVPVMVRSPKEKMKFYPCSACHRPSTSLGEVPLTAQGQREGHRHRTLEFKHMPEVQECFICHGHQNPDTLDS
ncbi:MAG: hypothetical protein HYY62_06500 [Deltaproteobacteria bacterium]|nr:hypothetical protein [Deltaproteobacteria bacterium]